MKKTKTHLFKSALPPPPPPPPTPSVKTGRKMKRSLIVIALIAIILVATVLLFFFNVIPWPFKSGGGTSNVTYGVLMGKVVDTAGNPVSNVTVSVGGQTGTTNDQGWFSVTNVAPGNKQLVTFDKNGSATTYQVTDIQTGKSSFVKATVGPVDETDSFDASQGATITNPADNGYIAIGADSLSTSQGVAYTGTATVSMTTFDPSNELEANAFPGEYLGVSAQNLTAVPIKSYGFMDISVTGQNGEKLKLTTGKNATIAIPVPASMQVVAGALGTCPLWYFDTSAGIWREEGQGTFDAGSGCFIGTVSHFSTWNFDIRYPAAYVSGRVVDSSGNPVQDAQVKCWGTGWYQQRWASGETGTAVNGTFTRIPVEVGVTFKYQASKGGHESAILQAGPLQQNQEYNVGDIVLDAPLITIVLSWGENPSDLDSHLAARLNGNVTFHVYYDAKGSLTMEPYANLDTDDTSGYGPEVTTISKLRQGTYRFSVRHYAGEGNISTSSAAINLIIPDTGTINRYNPPAGQPTGTDIWRVFDITIDSNGKVTAVNTINDYVTGNDNSDLLYPP